MSKILQVQNVSKTYGRGDSAVSAIKDVSFTLEEGELTLVMGPSGSGKTTLLLMCGALLRPDTGGILLDDMDITDMTEKTLPEVRLRKIGFIFQQFNLLSDFTAVENVEWVLNARGIKGEKARKLATEALARVGLSTRVNHLPEGLSGGEKQRVGIARALANNPRLIIADEPTANIDSKAGTQIIETIREIAKTERKAAIIASHDGRIQKFSDKLLTLEDGRLTEGAV